MGFEQMNMRGTFTAVVACLAITTVEINAATSEDMVVGVWQCGGNMPTATLWTRIRANAAGELVKYSIMADNERAFMPDTLQVLETGRWERAKDGVRFHMQTSFGCDDRVCNYNEVSDRVWPIWGPTFRLNQVESCTKIKGQNAQSFPAGISPVPPLSGPMQSFSSGPARTDAGYEQLRRQIEEETRQHCRTMRQMPGNNPFLAQQCAGH